MLGHIQICNGFFCLIPLSSILHCRHRLEFTELVDVYLGSLNLDPAEIRVYVNTFYDFEAPEKKNSTKVVQLL
jgi:hypothetical protein